MADSLSPHSVLALGVTLKFIQVAAHICVSIGVAMSKVHYIGVMLKRDRPRQRVVVSSILTPHRVLVVADIAATTNPALACALGFTLRVDQWSHTVVIERVRLHQVDDVEAVLLASASVGYPEVVPLGIPSCVIIRLQD